MKNENMELMYNEELMEINGGTFGIDDFITFYPIINAAYEDAKEGLKDLVHNCATVYNS